jgi:hypothetical protein
MRYRILIIGCGNIGSKYVQAIKGINLKIDLYLSDKKNFLIKKLPCRNKKKNINIFPLSKKNKIKNFDLCIISTTANVRLKILKNTLKKFTVKKFILEKILCQSISDLKKFLKLKKKYNFKSWIPCHRSLWIDYISLKKKIDVKKINNFSLEVTGSRWSIGSNSIHFMHLANFLFGPQDYKYSTFEIKNSIKWISSKRKNFFDFNGRVKFLFQNNSKIILEDCIRKNRIKNFKIIIKYNNKIIEVDELNSKITINNKKSRFKEELLSEVFKREVHKILVFKESNLPTLDETFHLHQFIIKNLLLDWNKFNRSNSNKILPIT